MTCLGSLTINQNLDNMQQTYKAFAEAKKNLLRYLQHLILNKKKN